MNTRSNACKLTLAAFGLVALVNATPARAQTGISLSIVPALALDRESDSPNYPIYAANAIYALEHNISSVGDFNTDPTAYHRISGVTPNQIVATPEVGHSWLGNANPAPAFASEFGNRIEWGLRVLGNGQQFALSQLDVHTTSSLAPGDLHDQLEYTDSLNQSFYKYNFRRVGINYGADRIKGTADDIRYQNGEDDTLPIDELLYTGVIQAFEIEPTDPGTNLQEQINNLLAQVPADPFTVGITYTLNSPDRTSVLTTATSTLTVTPVPEPGAVALLSGLGVCGVGFALRRRRQRRVSDCG